MMELDEIFISLSVLGFFALFFIIWAGVLFLLSKLSGWSLLFEKFPCSKPFKGRLHYMKSAKIGKVKYNNAIVFGANEEGLYIVPFFIFRLIQKPILIPWSELTPEKYSTLGFASIRLHIDSLPKIKICMLQKNFDKIIECMHQGSQFNPNIKQ